MHTYMSDLTTTTTTAHTLQHPVAAILSALCRRIKRFCGHSHTATNVRLYFHSSNVISYSSPATTILCVSLTHSYRSCATANMHATERCHSNAYNFQCGPFIRRAHRPVATRLNTYTTHDACPPPIAYAFVCLTHQLVVCSSSYASARSERSLIW